MRILPGDTVDDAVEHIKNVNKGIDFNIELLNKEEASPVSPIDSEAYRIITSIINNIFPETIPVPYLMAGGTDSRKFYNVCNNIYRFSPVILTNEDKGSIHSVNEKITVENLKNMIEFFVELDVYKRQDYDSTFSYDGPPFQFYLSACPYAVY